MLIKLVNTKSQNQKKIKKIYFEENINNLVFKSYITIKMNEYCNNYSSAN